MNTIDVRRDPTTNYVEIQLHGSPEHDEYVDLVKHVNAINQDLVQEGLPKIGLIDATNDKTFSPTSNRAALDAIQELDYDFAAIYGVDPVPVSMLRALVRTLNKGENTAIFSSRDEAVAWIVEKTTPSASDS